MKPELIQHILTGYFKLHGYSYSGMEYLPKFYSFHYTRESDELTILVGQSGIGAGGLLKAGVHIPVIPFALIDKIRDAAKDQYDDSGYLEDTPLFGGLR